MRAIRAMCFWQCALYQGWRRCRPFTNRSFRPAPGRQAWLNGAAATLSICSGPWSKTALWKVAGDTL